MKRPLSALVLGFALATVYALPLTGPLVSPQHELIFHLPTSATVIFVPVVLNFLLLTIVLTCVLVWVQNRPRAELIVWAALLLLLPVSLMDTSYGFAGRPVPSGLKWSVLACVGIAFFWTLLRSSSFIGRFGRIRHGLTTVLSFVALSGLLLLIQLLWYGWQARNLNPAFVPRADTGGIAQPEGPRVVWVILDELSYEQIFERRVSDLNLPNFDRLAGEAINFTQAEPTAEFTRVAAPALLTGLELDTTTPSADGQRLSLHQADVRGSRALEPSDTIFGDAARAGLFTGLAGWYEPYCRLLPGVLNHCFWTYSDELPGGMLPDATIFQNTVQPLRKLALQALHGIGIGPGVQTPGRLDVQRHRSDYLKLLAAGDALLAENRPGLVLLHMPIPHPWGMYDRHQNRFSDDRTSYIDNLALADVYLGHLRSVLERQGAWDRTTLVVMGDHSWRSTFVWSQSEHWTDEEEEASDDETFDKRPACLVKLAGQHAPLRLDETFEMVRTRSLIKALLDNQIRTPEALQRWVVTAN